MKIRKATVVVERNVPEYKFPKEWKFAFHDEDEMMEQTDYLHWSTMRDKYGWGRIAGVTSSNLHLRPDVEYARKSKIICRKDILKSGVMGEHMFDDRGKAKTYFKNHFVLERIEIEPRVMIYLQSLIDSTTKIDTICSICTDEVVPSDTTATLPCHHTFCFSCVKRLVVSVLGSERAAGIRRNFLLECPNCRSPILNSVVEEYTEGSNNAYNSSVLSNSSSCSS